MSSRAGSPLLLAGGADAERQERRSNAGASERDCAVLTNRSTQRDRADCSRSRACIRSKGRVVFEGSGCVRRERSGRACSLRRENGDIASIDVCPRENRILHF
jgi:hypothetical protein